MILFVFFIVIFLLVISILLINKSNKGFKECMEGMTNDERTGILKKNINRINKNKKYPILSNLGIEPDTSSWLIFDNDSEMIYGNLESKKEGFDDGNTGVFIEKQVDETPPDLINKIKKCKTITSCSELNNNSYCGFCPDTKKYMYYDNDDFPNGIQGCKSNLLTTVEDCEVHHCSQLKNCSDIALKGSMNECGYCPNSTKVVPLVKRGEDMVSKYNYGATKCQKNLVVGEECANYDNDACKHSRYSNLKPNSECINDTWEKMGCKNMKKRNEYYNKGDLTFKSLVDNINTFLSGITSSNYPLAKQSSISCLGSTDNINPCNNKYLNANNEYPNDCYKQKGYFKKEGFSSKEGFANQDNYLKYCNKSAMGYKTLMDTNLDAHKDLLKKIEGRTIDMKNLDEYSDYLRQIKEYTKGKNLEKYGRTIAEEEAIQKRAAEFCTNEVVQKRGPLQIGDKIKLEKDGKYWVGYIYSTRGAYRVTVMWTEIWDKNNKVLRRRRIGDYNEGRRLWGWPGKAYKNEQLLSGEKTYARSMLKLVKKCDLAGTSGCVLSCEKIIQILKDRYPEPRDCIVTPWHDPKDPNPKRPRSEWGACSDTCKRADENPRMTSVRKILQTAARGGKPCPKTLIKHKPCNTHICTDPDFNKATKITLKRSLYGCPKQSFTYIGKHGRYNHVWKGDRNRYLNEEIKNKVNVTVSGRYGNKTKTLTCGTGPTIMTQSRNYKANGNCSARDACVVKVDNNCDVSVMMQDRCKSARSRYKYSNFGKNVSADGCNAVVNNVSKNDSKMYCCTQTRYCSGRHGGWFTHFNKKDQTF